MGIGSFVFSGVLWKLVWDAATTGVVVGKYGAAANSHSLIYWLLVPLYVVLALTFAWGGVDSIRKARAEQRADDTPK
jgi:hypothetical protein